MRFWMDDRRRRGDIQAFLRIFFPSEEVGIHDDPSQSDIRLYAGEGKLKVSVLLNGTVFEKEGEGDFFDLKRLLLTILTELGFHKPSWGVLMGIRPTKLVFRMIDKGMDKQEIYHALTEKYMLDPEKAALLMAVCESEKDILATEAGIQIYIGIPFCPSRCSYCSFTSYQADRYQNEFDSYLDSLIEEIDAFKEVFLEAETVYIGGGTPTTLNEAQLERLLGYVAELLPSEIKEFTVEAGRPDTITLGKLRTMKKHGVTRISVNPQTFNDTTLKAIGRKHSADAVVEAYNLAREMGFDSVNMDLIAGLPGETADDVEKTMDVIAALMPDNVTVHTLAIKRSTEMNETGDYDTMDDRSRIEPMLDSIYRRLAAMEYEPYYLYRQKQMLGQYENVGFERGGKPCLYNIHMIEETGPVYAFGAGTVSKQVTDGRITRADNPKNVHVYMDGIDQIIEKKKKLYYNNRK